MTDERLLEQAASGDETAFAVIYERHRGLVFRFAYRLSQSREMAEEITHDCFLSLIKEPQRFKTHLPIINERGKWNLWALYDPNFEPSQQAMEKANLNRDRNCCLYGGFVSASQLALTGK